MDDVASPPEPEPISDALGERVPLRWSIPAGVVSRYAHHMLVQASDFEVTLSFFELKPPIILGDTPLEEQREIIKDGVLAECVARITIARARYSEFIKAFTSIGRGDDNIKPGQT